MLHVVEHKKNKYYSFFEKDGTKNDVKEKK
jgi:hypothetical protein